MPTDLHEHRENNENIQLKGIILIKFNQDIRKCGD